MNQNENDGKSSDWMLLYQRGVDQIEKKQYLRAVENFDSAILAYPGFAVAYAGLALAHANLRDYESALQSADQALKLNPTLCQAHSYRGFALCGLRRFEEAVQNHRQAISFDAENPEAHFYLGRTLWAFCQYKFALLSFDTALFFKPNYAEAIIFRAHVYIELKLYRYALREYEKAETLTEDPIISGYIVDCKRHMCDWQDVALRHSASMEHIRQGHLTIQPFSALYLTDDLELQRRSASRWALELYNFPSESRNFPRHAHHEKIRIGYFSGDFREHPVSTLLAGLLENHNGEIFEVTAFSFMGSKSPMQDRIKNAVDRFVDVHDWSDRQIAEYSRELQIDISVDLAGYTGNCRPGVFARRAAPVQASYLGFLGTMGAEFNDYIFADHVVITEAMRGQFVEKIVYLPCYQSNDKSRPISDKVSSRMEAGLDADAVVFCCLNTPYKYTSIIFRAWMEILRRVNGSVLYLYYYCDDVVNNLRSEAVNLGVDPTRLIFGGNLPFPEYMARYQLMDIFLDTLPYNAGTTASDALWAGLPVVTCIGETFPGRMAASLLKAVGLWELVTHNLDEYVDLAVNLATNRERLREIRRKLLVNRDSARLFNAALHARDMEVAYKEMYRRYRNGIPPGHIEVGDGSSCS